eukprot:11194354-Lingulodinium_polyedra.AAC.1
MVAAKGRFAQVGRLPVEFRRRCTAGAAAGTAAGATLGTPAKTELGRPRAAARTTVTHGAARAVPEL